MLKATETGINGDSTIDIHTHGFQIDCFPRLLWSKKPSKRSSLPENPLIIKAGESRSQVMLDELRLVYLPE